MTDQLILNFLSFVFVNINSSTFFVVFFRTVPQVRETIYPSPITYDLPIDVRAQPAEIRETIYPSPVTYDVPVDVRAQTAQFREMIYQPVVQEMIL